MARVKYDWEAIEKDYRTGQMTNYALAEKYGCSEGAIRKRIKKEDWKKDLIEEYQKEVENQLLSDGTLGGTQNVLKGDKERKEDKQIVSDAAKVGVEVVRSHRKHLAKLRELSEELTRRVSNFLLEGDAEGLVQIQGDRESLTDMVWKLSKVDSEIIKNERQAFNLDKKEEKKGTVNNDVEDRIKAHMKKNGYQA